MNIIELAKQANGEPAWNGGVDWTWEELEAFAALVAAHEREECAYRAGIALLGADRGLANRVEQAIRARGAT